MKLRYRLVAMLYLGFAACGPLWGILPWWTQESVWYHLPKLFYWPTIAVLLVHWLRTRKKLSGYFDIYLVAYGSFLLGYGLIANGLTLTTLKHIQALSLPILGITFGLAVIRDRGDFNDVIEKGIPWASAILLLLVTAYYVLANSGVVRYFGVSTLVALPFAWALSRDRVLLALVFLGAAILTGKRVSIIGLAVLFLVYLWQRKSDRPVAVLGIAVAGIALVAFGGSTLADASLFRRLAFLWSTEEAINLNVEMAGRIGEAGAVVDLLARTPPAWLIGFGAGATFTWATPSGFPATEHYAHFSPLAYIFLGGLLLAVPIYVFLFRGLKKFIVRSKEWYQWMFIYYVIASFSGAIVFSDPFVWIVVGMASSDLELHRSRHSVATGLEKPVNVRHIARRMT